MVRRNNRRVIGLWANYQPKNSWAYMRFGTTNEGWKRCRVGTSDAVTNMTILLTHAKADGRRVNYEEDPANRIKELYVW